MLFCKKALLGFTKIMKVQKEIMRCGKFFPSTDYRREPIIFFGP